MLPPALPVLNVFGAIPQKLNRHSRHRAARFFDWLSRSLVKVNIGERALNSRLYYLIIINRFAQQLRA
jgi:hypothetical protein